ncbi:hypothetical protein THASP1DRAFT_25082 [Thamnocephalis sphaerospora]|uniref:RGS domain-containing protein n=1 Tax=Thamnocephalis sphaerospora TaxID=78915 RepID=A0A4P9XLE5_9FUNG|nr:hypothetical protein THASP1DRAFT_25082 [Thamnocephalis sphaerospora]|eukprot:RKP06635.1 hypothetical protein THASP1DRAFT_25082 [Thamnocephalis sphaerospora]
MLFCIVVVLTGMQMSGTLGSFSSVPGPIVTDAVSQLNCTVDWGYLPALFFLALALLGIAPLLAYLVHRERDPHRVLPELLVTLFITISTLGTHIALFITTASTANEVHLVFSSIVLVVGVLLGHGICVVRPTFVMARARRASGKPFGTDDHAEADHTRAAFTRLLESPERRQAFKHFAMRDYSVENVLFYELVTDLLARDGFAGRRKQSKRTRRPLSTFSGLSLKHAGGVNDTAAWLDAVFLDDASPLQVNLTHATQRLLRDAAREGHIESHTLQMALHEIESLMYESMYPRFLRYPHDEYSYIVDKDPGKHVASDQYRLQERRSHHGRPSMDITSTEATANWVRTQCAMSSGCT